MDTDADTISIGIILQETGVGIRTSFQWIDCMRYKLILSEQVKHCYVAPIIRFAESEMVKVVQSSLVHVDEEDTLLSVLFLLFGVTNTYHPRIRQEIAFQIVTQIIQLAFKWRNIKMPSGNHAI